VEIKDKKSTPGKPEAGHDSTPKGGSAE
jgi:hypothetical protein